MYKEYRLQSAGKIREEESKKDVDCASPNASHNSHGSGKNYQQVTDEPDSYMPSVVEIWDKIEATVDRQSGDRSASDLPARPVVWQNVRLFVSSTFTDFHSERELLVKKVNCAV